MINSKLPVEKIIEIKTLYATGKYTHMDLANKYEIGKRTVANYIKYPIERYSLKKNILPTDKNSTVYIKLVPKNDLDIINHLNNIMSTNKYLKDLIREDIKKRKNGNR